MGSCRAYLAAQGGLGPEQASKYLGAARKYSNSKVMRFVYNAALKIRL